MGIEADLEAVDVVRDEGVGVWVVGFLCCFGVRAFGHLVRLSLLFLPIFNTCRLYLRLEENTFCPGKHSTVVLGPYSKKILASGNLNRHIGILG